MGDRVNVKIVYSEGNPIYLYSHCGGDRMAETVRQAIIRGQRWDDDSYLARIIFCEMLQRTAGEGKVSPQKKIIGTLREETGFGISPYEIDPQNPTIVVDVPNKTVTFGKSTPVPFSSLAEMAANEVRTLHLGN